MILRPNSIKTKSVRIEATYSITIILIKEKDKVDYERRLENCA